MIYGTIYVEEATTVPQASQYIAFTSGEYSNGFF